jgi:hypothetical protein
MIVLSEISECDKIDRFIYEDDDDDAVLCDKTMFECLISKQASDNVELDVLQFIE